MAMDKFRPVMERLRAYEPSDPHFFGSIDGSRVPCDLMWTRDKDPAISGPFHIEHDFKHGLREQPI